MTTVTQWFPITKKPVHVGIYFTFFYFEDMAKFRYFDGTHWKEITNGAKSASQHPNWRGLAVKP